MGAEVDRSTSYERTISDLQSQTQSFNPQAREAVQVAVRLLQLAWNIQRGTGEAMSNRDTEARSNR